MAIKIKQLFDNLSESKIYPITTTKAVKDTTLKKSLKDILSIIPSFDEASEEVSNHTTLDADSLCGVSYAEIVKMIDSSKYTKSGIREDYPLLINEEFTTVNTDLWCKRNMDMDINGSIYRGHGVDIVDGQMYVRPFKNSDGVWESADFMSKFGVYNTLVEAKIKIPQTPNVCNAFWTMGCPPVSVGGSCYAGATHPLCGEIDIAEQETWEDRTNTLSGTIHVCTNTTTKEINSTSIYGEREFDTEFHVYGMYYGDEGLRIYIDRELVVSKTQQELMSMQQWNPYVFQFPQYLLFSSQVTNSSLGVSGNPANDDPMVIDWVRVYEVKSDRDFIVRLSDGTKLDASVEHLMLGEVSSMTGKVGEISVLFIKHGNITNYSAVYKSGLFYGGLVIPTSANTEIVYIMDDGDAFPLTITGTV